MTRQDAPPPPPGLRVVGEELSGLIAPATSLRPAMAELARTDGYLLPGASPDPSAADARTDARCVIEWCGIGPTSSVLDLGCGTGDLVVGLVSESGSVGQYTGVASTSDELVRCRDRLARLGYADARIELVLGAAGVAHQRIEQGGPIGLELPADRRYDLIRLAACVVSSELSEYLRFCRHHLADGGAVLIEIPDLADTVPHDTGPDDTSPDDTSPDDTSPDDGSRSIRGDLARMFAEAGLVITAVVPGVGARSRMVLGDGRSPGPTPPMQPVVRRLWDQRRIAELERRAERLTADVEQLHTTITELTAALDDRDRRLVDARRTLSRRSVRATVDLTNRARDVRAGRLRRPRPAPEASTAAVAGHVRAPRAPSAPSDSAVAVAPAFAGGPADLVVYTAVVHELERLPEVPPAGTSVDGVTVRYVCFAAVSPADAAGWEVRPIQFVSDDPLRTVAFHAVHPHLLLPDEAVSMWIEPEWLGLILSGTVPAETAIRLAGPVLGTPQPAGTSPLAAPPAAMAAFPNSTGPLEPTGPHETGVLVRRHHDPGMLAVARAWWATIERAGPGDRLGFAPTVHAAGLGIAPLDAAAVGGPEQLVAQRRADASPRGSRPRSAAGDTAHRRIVWSIRAPVEPAGRGRGRRAAPALGPVDVVVPIHDALPYVQRCINSVLDDPGRDGRVVLVDDGSGPATRQWCDALAAQRTDVIVLRNELAYGFSAACNLGIQATDAPVVTVLNSDTVVPTNWTRRMARRMESHDGIGLVGPLSNAASWQSVPRIWSAEGGLAVNGLPPGLDLEGVNTFLAELCLDVVTPIVGALNGFCMMIRREVLETIGGFDQQTFTHGYGEELDLVLRATDAGFLSGIAPDTYVYHAKSQSFGAARREELKAIGRQQVIARYGRERVNRVARSTRQHPVLEFVRDAVAELYQVPTPPMVPIVGP